jgi:MFS family permease
VTRSTGSRTLHLHATGSELEVALESAARSVPLLLTGAFIGVLSDAVNRKRIVATGLSVTAMSSAVVSVIGMCGVLLPWHLGVAALVSRTVYATEMPARRKMIAECAGDDARLRAVAVDSMTTMQPAVCGSACRWPPVPASWLAGGVPYLGRVKHTCSA